MHLDVLLRATCCEEIWNRECFFWHCSRTNSKIKFKDNLVKYLSNYRLIKQKFYVRLDNYTKTGWHSISPHRARSASCVGVERTTPSLERLIMTNFQNGLWKLICDMIFQMGYINYSAKKLIWHKLCKSAINYIKCNNFM